MVQFTNLAGAYLSNMNDGNLIPEPAAAAPRVLIVGTAGKGRGSELFLPANSTEAKSEFGNEGTLLRGYWEAVQGGAKEVGLFRIGATSAIVTGIGDSSGVAGYTVETRSQDASAGDSYALYYDDSTDRLVVTRTSDDLVVFDNDSTYPIDRFEVTVSGFRASGGGGDIGSPSALVTLSDIDPSTYPGTSYTAGTDGLDLSRMEMYEALYNAYKQLLENQFDVLVPMDVYLDDYNVVNQGHYRGAVTPVVPVGSTYPTAGAYQPGSDVDSLGRVFVEEYEGRYYFWWWFNDGTGVFSSADIYPASGPGSASATTKIDGTDLSAADFHEVNFAYQMSRFLYEYSMNIVNATGVIGVLPPDSNSLSDKARWLGKAPTWTTNTQTGVQTIASASDNGSGLLGNKFMAGQYAHRSGAYGGGFIATDVEFMDGAEILDDNDLPIDLGKYFSVVVDWPLLRNNYLSTGYITTWAAKYGGMYSDMPSSSAPTNKIVTNAEIVYQQGLRNLDLLAGAGYVVLRRKPQGVVIGDAPTATLPTSDWRRLSTVRIVKDVVDGVRFAVEPFLGEGTSAATRSAMQGSVEKVLLGAKKNGFLQDYRPFTVFQTPQMEVEGTIQIKLVLIPAYEIRQIEITVSVSRSG